MPKSFIFVKTKLFVAIVCRWRGPLATEVAIPNPTADGWVKFPFQGEIVAYGSAEKPMKYFGTDGIRGKFGSAPMDGEFFQRLAAALERFCRRKTGERRLTICLGRDTRDSGIELALALVAGFSRNMHILDCGILPTPAIAGETILCGADLGIAITASHNPPTDNGIKIFDGEGKKLTEAEEEILEKFLDEIESGPAEGTSVTDFHAKARGHYADRCRGFLPRDSLRGRTIAIDTANGATVEVAGEIFGDSGATVIWVGNSPDGKNINLGCGTEHPEALAAAMAGGDVSLGIAYDGDGDRVVMFDECGDRVDGDVLIGTVAGYLSSTGDLPNGGIVVTVQSNLGLDVYLKTLGVTVIRCDIGDRNVYRTMEANDCQFGGENSGHLIFRKFSPTGDGLVASSLILSMLRRMGTKLSQWKTKIALFPQKCFNISVDKKVPFSDIMGLEKDIKEVQNELGPDGRAVVRYSGTENKIRGLVESPDRIVVDNAWCKLTKSIISRAAENNISATIA
jgi:phosphoglucosamine mutase